MSISLSNLVCDNLRTDEMSVHTNFIIGICTWSIMCAIQLLVVS
jgi:hypothetical protein